MPDLCRFSLLELKQQLLSRDISATSLVADCLQTISRTEPSLKALLCVREEKALAEAAALDQAGPDPKQPLWGIPVVIKDVITTQGTVTTCGSKILENFIPPYDAQVIAKLKQAGAIILAKANMDEFAMGSSTENSAYQVTHNPWDFSRVPGGSSGGSAASVAAGQTPASLGTDTGGSIRQPASFCGIVGMKPTYGRVSRFGLVAYGSSLDQIGPMTRTVADNALMLQTIAGHDPKDSTSADQPVPDYLASLSQGSNCRGVRIGIPAEYWGEGMDVEVEKACRQALDRLKNLGATIVPVSMPHTPFGIAAYYIIAMAEASSNLARFDGVKYGLRDQSASNLAEMYARTRSLGFGEEVKRRILLGTYVLSSGYYDAYYKKAAQVRRLIRRDFDQALSQCDLLCAPVSPTTAFPIGSMNADPLTMYLMDIYTITLNLAGLPGLALPVGLGQKSNLPVGIQFFGPAFGEDKLYTVGHTLEQNLPPLPWPKALANPT